MDDSDDELELARADADALESHNARLAIIVGPILFVAGISILALGIAVHLERVAVLGFVAGWTGLLSTFGGLVATFTGLWNLRDLKRARADFEAEPPSEPRKI